MIEPVVEELLPLVENELNRANLSNPPFHSSHEGVAVIEEELMEAVDNMATASNVFTKIKRDVYHDKIDRAREEAERMKREAIYTAAEMIQVAAMCEKFTR